VFSALVLIGALSQLGAAAEAYCKMSDAEIRGKVTGMEITDEAHFSEQYMRDGTVRIVNLGRRFIAAAALRVNATDVLLTIFFSALRPADVSEGNSESRCADQVQTLF